MTDRERRDPGEGSPDARTARERGVDGDPDAPRGLRVVRALARTLLRLYPREVREEAEAVFLDVAQHRWRKERRRGRGATLRTVRVLLVDTARALPRVGRGGGPTGGRHGDVPSPGGGARRPHGGSDRVPHLRRRRGRGISAAGVAMMGRVLGDARHAARSLSRRPMSSALIVLILGTGIGAGSAIFGVLDRVLLRPLPYADGDRMVFVALRELERGFRFSPTQDVLERWREGARTLVALEVFIEGTAFRTGAGVPEVLDRMEVSGGLPGMLGVRPVAGRMLGPADAVAGAPPVAMVGEGYWRRELGGRADVVGGSLSLDDTIFTVVGVWPRSAPLTFDRQADVWTVLPAGSEADPSSFSQVLGVMAAGASPAMVEDELAALVAGTTLFGRPAGEGVRPTVLPPYGFLGEDFVAGVRVASVGVVLLLLAAVANAANLLLNRATSRGGELGVRLALGASGGAVIRLFLLESGMLAAVGGTLGVAVARRGGAALAALAPDRLPDLGMSVASPRALLWGLAAAAGAALVCGLAPALRLRSPEVRRLLDGREATGGRSSTGAAALVAFQVGLAVVLVVGAGLTIRSLRALSSVDPGFDLERLVVLSVDLPPGRYPEAADRRAFRDRAAEALAALPGVEGVTTSGVPPLGFSTMRGEPHLVEGAPAEPEGRWSSQADAPPGYFEVMGIPVLEGSGRAPEASGEGGVGGPEARYYVVNRTFADRYPGSVVGRRLVVGSGDAGGTIVGVVGNVRDHGLTDDEERVQYYVLSREDGARGWLRFIVRAGSAPADVRTTVRRRLAELDPAVRVRRATTGPQILRTETADQRFLAAVLGVFGTVSLAIAVLGVFGSVSLAVRRRTREIGIRLALGAGGRRVARHVLVSGLRPTAVGVLAGSAAALVLARWIAPALYRVEATDPVSFAAAAVLLVSTATAACLLPARRAVRVDPVRVLGTE